MNSTGHLQRAHLAALLFFLPASAPSHADQPTPTPTPTPAITRREVHLGEYAERITLDPSVLKAISGTVTITTDLVAGIGDRGAITTSAAEPVSSGPEPVPTPKPAGAKRRSYWRKLVQKQRDVISDVETELALLDATIDALEDAAFHGGRKAKTTWARLAEAKDRRSVIEGRLKRERSRLSSIVRQARLEGAEPGWFR